MNSRQQICLPSSSNIPFLCYGLVMMLVTMATIRAYSYGGNETDHEALLKIKSLITYDPNGALSSWNTSSHFCDWNGVVCGKRHKRVTIVRLISQGLVGSMSPYVGNLSFLIGFSLRNNSFHGSIPHELGRLSRLRVLVLEHNKFNEVIPTNVSSCSNLEELWLGDNKLVGSIPKEISFLSNLAYISLFYNELTGGIPSFLGNITSLKGISIPGNPLGGNIPDVFDHLKSLTTFLCGECNLHGTIPYSIYNLSLLKTFSLAENKLTGSLPLAIGGMLPHLTEIQLRNNQLTGVLPPSFSNCSELKVLDFSDNNITGKLTIDFSKLKDIYEISLGNNHYEHRGEADEMKFIDSLKNCSSLQILELDNCKLKGLLPTSIGNLSDQLYFLTLASNQLRGSLPSSIGNLAGLTTLYIGYNRFIGKIPSTIGMLHKLQYAGLHENQFSGAIPDAIGNLSLLITLYLHSNRLEDQIPSSLGNCHQLLELSLDRNKLSGQIPKQLLQLSTLSILLNLSQNNLSGSLPSEVGGLKLLSSLDLSYNYLSGSIPSSLGDCISLTLLSLKGNLLQGMIPPSLGSLRGLEVLDLSQNNLSGQIPRFLERFLLRSLNLSFNDFEGEVPVKGVFSNASAFTVLGNSRLCGGLVELVLPKCKETEKHKKRFPLFVIIPLIVFTLFTILCFMYVCSKKKNIGQPYPSSRNEQFLNVTYHQLLKATNGFSEANLIGKGGLSSVYKGILNNDGTFVAIKVLNLQNQGAQRSFMRECEAWRNIRHRNLLKIITSCSSVDFQGNDFKALVYEFMPNGSLHDWLHSSAPTSILNLLQRINILNNVASALDYLHNHCLAVIVHGDLKPSNILLDDDMVAHVGDFGLARFLETNAKQNNSTGVKGTIGYAPPEYGLGSEMTSSGDVYSFGILLLELMTGKRPTDNIFHEELTLHKYSSLALPDNVIDIIDQNLLSYHQNDANAKKIVECLVSTIKIGLSCSMDSPSQRMNIENVVHELQHILDMLQYL